jgi:uncharacterized protein (DUF4415 family)
MQGLLLANPPKEICHHFNFVYTKFYMKKKYIELSAQELLTKAKGSSTGKKQRSSQIDYSDIPRFSAQELKKFRRVGRPLVGDSPRVAISVRIEEQVLLRLKKKAHRLGTGYQSLINEILKKAV